MSSKKLNIKLVKNKNVLDVSKLLKTDVISNSETKSDKLIMNSTKKELNELESIIIFQKYIRGFLVRKKCLIPDACYQTKNWRKNQIWYNNGKSNECENYQRNIIEKITNTKCSKTKYRINTINNELVIKLNPLSNEDGFDYTEDFDGLQDYNNKQYLYNLKFVCDRGGAQTRTLREVYHFIRAQLEYLLKCESSKTKKEYLCFVNILDGDESYKNMDKFNYLLKNSKYISLKNLIFIGDMKQFQEWFISESK